MSASIEAARATVETITRLRGRPLPAWGTILSIMSGNSGPGVVNLDAGMEEQLPITRWSSWFAQEMFDLTPDFLVGRRVRIDWDSAQPVIAYSIVIGQPDVDYSNGVLF